MSPAVSDLLTRFVAPFHRLGLPYMVTGGAAAIVYGDPRLTNDIDLVLDMQPEDASRVAEALQAEDTYVPPVEVLEVEAGRLTNGHFNVIHGPTSLRADVYVAGSDPLHVWGLARRLEIRLGSLSVSLAPPEYVIVRKLQYAAMSGGDRHLRDIHRMLARQLAPIDRDEIARYAQTHGVETMWDRATRWSEPT